MGLCWHYPVQVLYTHRPVGASSVLRRSQLLHCLDFFGRHCNPSRSCFISVSSRPLLRSSQHCVFWPRECPNPPPPPHSSLSFQGHSKCLPSLFASKPFLLTHGKCHSIVPSSAHPPTGFSPSRDALGAVCTCKGSSHVCALPRTPGL